jgi:ankyrin repeat protein
LEFLKEKAAGLSKEELNSELDSSAYWGYLRSVEYLLTQGADPNWRDPYTSRTILQGAARNGHGAVLRVLVGAGADINAAGSLGQTALHESVIDGHKAAAEFLIERGANLGIRDSDGMNPLAWAAYVGNLEMTKLLLAHGADVNVHDKGDNTPLIYAIRLVGGSRREVWGMPDHIGVIKALLANGADVNVVNWQGNTPLTVAKEYRRSSVINLLRQHGAREKEK